MGDYVISNTLQEAPQKHPKGFQEAPKRPPRGITSLHGRLEVCPRTFQTIQQSKKACPRCSTWPSRRAKATSHAITAHQHLLSTQTFAWKHSEQNDPVPLSDMRLDTRQLHYCESRTSLLFAQVQKETGLRVISRLRPQKLCFS